MSAWPTATLGSVAEIVSGSTPKTSNPDYWDGGIAWATPRDLSRLAGLTIESTERNITPAGLASCGARVLPPGSILLSSRAPIGHVAINTIPMATNQGFKSLVPREGLLDSRFAAHWLRGQRDHLQGLGNGATFKELSKGTTESIEIPLPPVGEQRRIAAILDLMEDLLVKRRQAIALLDRLTQQIFLDMFGDLRGRFIESGAGADGGSGSWDLVPLGSVARLATGHTPDRDRPEYWGGEIPWLSLPDIRANDTRSCHGTSLNVTDQGIAASSAVVLPTGTVAFSRTASIGFVTVMGRPMSTSQDFFNWVCGPDLLPSYLMYAFINSRSRLRRLADGSTHKTIYMRNAEQFQVRCPPIQLQKEFARRVEDLESQRYSNTAGIRMAERLADALRHRAFAGSL